MTQELKQRMPEQERFHELEIIIEEGREAWYNVGCAIWEIRERKLYKPDYKTFEEYCKERWGWSRRHCDQVASASRIIQLLPDAKTRTAVPISRAAATELGKVPEEERPAVIAEASKATPKGKTISSMAIRSATPPPKKKQPDVELDKVGRPIPSKVLPLWNRAFDASEILSHISIARVGLIKYRDSADPLFAEVDFPSALSNLDQAYGYVKEAKPFAVCPSCQGKMPEGCGTCKGRGLVSEWYWNTCVTDEVKELCKKANT